MPGRLFSLLLLAPSVLTLILSQGEAQRRPAQEARIPGLLNMSPEARREVIMVPSSVAVGETFEITVTTSGGGCERAGDTSVVLGQSEANVMIYDMTVATLPNVACTMIYKTLPHKATLKFTKPGEGVIRIWGRRVGSDTTHFGVPAVLEHRITVR